MKDIQSDFNNSQEDISTPQIANSMESSKDLLVNDITKKSTNIPFISKISKEKKEELETKKKKVDEKKIEIKDEDEIDRLISNISKNNQNKGASRGKIIVEDSAKLDFDQDVKVDINKIKSNRFVNFNNSTLDNSASNINTNHNQSISKYFYKTGQVGLGSSSITPKNELVEIKSNQKLEKVSSINTSSITNIPIKSQVSNNNQVISNIPTKSSPNSNLNSVPSATNVSKINYTQIKPIIDISVLDCQPEITNSDLILCIIEICINSVYYGFKYSTKSKIFWENLLKKNEYKKIFENFKPETLKKYWIILSEIKEFTKAVDLINKNKELIDRKELK